MTAFNPGDINVNELVIGQFDYTKSFVSFDVYESIYTPGIVANITVLDTADYLGKQKLSGGEEISLSFNHPGGQAAEYKFVVNSIQSTSSPPGQKSKSYVIEAISKEILNSKDKYISKSYDKKEFSKMVEDIFKEFLKSSKKLNIEETKGMQNYVVQRQKPFAAIDSIRRRSVSPTSKSSTYIFFENQDGYHFTTLEKIFKDRKIVKTLVQNSATGSNFFAAQGGNIISAEIPQQMDIGKSTSSGVLNSEYNTFNMFTLEYKRKQNNKKPEDEAKKEGVDNRIKKSYISAHDSEPGYVAVLPVSNEKKVGLGGKSYIPEQTPVQKAYADSLASGVLKLSVPGDSRLKAGAMVTANLLNKNEFTTPQSLDNFLSGDFLITALRHKISSPGERPRYTCSLECMKGGYQNSVNEAG